MTDHTPGRDGVRVLLVPEDGGETRAIRLGGRTVRALKWAAVLSVVFLLALGGSWVYLAVRASRVDDLQTRLSRLSGQEERIHALAARLQEAEGRYDRIRELFGADTGRVASELWLPPSGGGERSQRDSDGKSTLPTSWPLTDRGFVTQPLLQGDATSHEGLDIAVPSHSYIRAAGPGEVVEVGRDSVYGNYVVLDHGSGYRSLYGHASETLVEQGERVRRDEVIALSGSTGRSTAPHLHFEIQHDGKPVDPLTMVHQP